MSKVRLFILVMAIFFSQALVAQNEIVVQGATPNLYIVHPVVAKETWFSIGRIYNLAPKLIADYNKLAMDKPLEIGQQVRVPLTAANFSQNDNAPREGLVPVYHIIQDREWFYRISVNHNKVPVERLEKWNNLNKDQARAGMKLIVGYLKTKDGALASRATGRQEAAGEIVSKKDTPVSRTIPVKEDASTPPTTATTADNKFPEMIDHKGGVFRGQYAESGKSASGVSGIFRSTSGWKDGKYYALMNNVPIGTIVKVSFPSTNKTVFAKVLGELPEMRESVGLAIRLSDAAASELGASSGRFSVEVKY